MPTPLQTDTSSEAPNKPDYLYKYASAARAAQIIRDLTFYFAPVLRLNDLYEFRLRSLYTETPDSKYKVYAKRLVHDGWFASLDEAIKSIKEGDFEAAATEAYDFFIQQLNGVLTRLMQHS